MIVETVIIVVAGWAAVVGTIVAPRNTFKNLLDRNVWKGSKTPNKQALMLAINHITTNTEDWSFSDNSAHFPKEGSKQFAVYIEKNEVDYYISGFDKATVALDSHFGKVFANLIQKRSETLKTEAVVRKLYPELVNNGVMMLEFRK